MGELGSGSGTSYPGAFDSDATVEVNSPNANKTKASANIVNDLAAALIAVQRELGTDPAGTLADLKTFIQTQHNTNGTHTESLVALLAGAQTFTGTKTFDDIIVKSPYIDVRAHGASTSGSASANDTAFASALAAMSAGKILYIPAGTYAYSQDIIYKSRYWIKGDGQEATILSYSGSGTGIKNDTVLTDYAKLSGFSVRNVGTGTIGWDAGHSRNGIFDDLSFYDFTTNVSFGKTTGAIANYYNRIYNVLTFNGTTGFVLGRSGDGANANFFYGIRSVSDTKAIHIINGSGNVIVAHIESGTDAIDLDAGSGNKITAYVENETNSGDLASGTSDNIVMIYIDGSASSMVDNGWNTIDDGARNTGIFRSGSEKIVTRLGTGSFTAATKNIFTLQIPYNGSFRVTVTEAGRIVGVDNYTETKIYNITRKGNGTATVTQLHTDGDNQLSTSVSSGTVTFIIAGHASIAARYQVAIEIVGNGSDADGVHVYPTYTKL